ncbi:phage tail protein [Acinetobacter sp. YH01009]|uniref:phage tail protein n=1 Tax=Acinetobacter sp. YH01009 TaxID=2601025 RepID=UPI00211EB0F8|nr:phage tail protein [Acinetobacter sp. YH01009]
MAKKKKQTIGYKYFASGHFVLCHGPIDAITKISFQDKDAYLNEENENKTIYINKPSLFGGDEQSGGVQGNIELLFGHADQQKSSTLQRICAKISNAFGGLISAYRGVCSVVFDNVYIGTAPNMPDSKWRVKRIHTRHDGEQQWYDVKAEILPPPSADNPAYNFAKLNWEMVGANGANGSSSVPVGNFGTSSFVINSPNISQNEIFEISIAITASTEFRDVIGGEQVGQYSWIKKGGVYGASASYNRYMIQISEPPETYYFNHGVSQQNYDDSERFAIIKVKVRNGARVTCICDPVDAQMAKGAKLGYYQYMRFDAASGLDRDINPAHIIRECLTNQVWGIGVSESNIDDVSFKKAADTLFDENMGMSIKWTDSTSINEFVDNIKEHINGQLYLDRVTNKWKLYLIRDDYDVADLISLDESNIRNLDFERRTLAECVNSVTVTYWDRERAKDSTVTVQDIARIAQQGGVISQSVDYKGFTNSDLASRIALRDLKTLSSTLASVSFDVDESFSESWHEGMPFKLSDVSYGLSEAVMRIRTIKRGDGINNTVYVEAIEDSFSSPMQSVIEYVPPITSGDSTAKNATSIAFEVPYIELVEQYGQDEVDAKLSNYPELGYVGMAAIRPNNQHINASLYVNAGAGYDERTTLDFCPNASLKNDIGYMDSSFEVENVAEFELLEANHRIQVDDEIMAFVSFDTVTNMLTVKRGCFDTVPQKHVPGSFVFGWDNYSGIDDLEYLSGEFLSLKALTLTGSDVLELNNATAHELTCVARAIRPYPPANVKINGEYYPEEIETDLILTWSDRNRLQETGGTPLSFFDNDVLIEANTQTHLILSQLDENQIELATSNENVTGATSYTMAISTMQADTRFLKITLKTVRDDYDCLQPFEYIVELSQFFSAPYDLAVEFKND